MFDYSVGMFSYLRHLSLLDLIASSTRGWANAEQFGAFIKAEIAKWSQIVKTARIEVR